MAEGPTVMKRIQGAAGPQGASVKGSSPVIDRTVSADMVSDMEGHIQGPTAKAPANPPGSKTAAHRQGRAGNSGDPMRSSDRGVGRHNRHTVTKPDGAAEVGCLHMSEDAG